MEVVGLYDTGQMKDVHPTVTQSPGWMSYIPYVVLQLN